MNFNRIETDLGIIHFCEGTKPTGLSKRDFQNQMIQALVREAGYASYSIEHKPSGQPYFKGEGMPHLSISHSENYAAIYIGASPLGIDIQTFHPRITEGKYYFINADEVQFRSNLELHIIWAVKEAIYKAFEGNLNDARQEITINAIDDNTSIVQAKVKNEYKQFGYVLTAEFVMAFSLD